MERSVAQSLSSRIRLLGILMLLAGGIFPAAKSHAQAPKAFLQVEIYQPHYDFRDGTPVKWWYAPGRLAEAKGSGIRSSVRFKRHSLSLSSSRFGVGYYKKGPVPVGEIDSRIIKLRNLDYCFRFINRTRFGAEAFAGISLRRGYETIVLAYPQWWEIITEEHTLHDWGARIGLRWEYKVWRDFHVSLETDYTYYFHRYDQGQPPNGFGTGSTIDQVALHVGVGYTIDRRFFTKEFWCRKGR